MKPSAINHQPSAKFTVFPAIDLRAGQVVRLAQGDPARQTLYATNPRAVAERWQAEGAEWLHVVNLDGAFGGDSMTNNQWLASIAAVGLPIQFGGGLRDETRLRRAFEAGISRAVIGTAAMDNPALVDWALREFGPERIAIGMDARDGKVRTKGWIEESTITAIELGQRLRAQGVEWCVFTDIARDGVGAGVNVTATADLARATSLSVIASGGVSSMADVQQVRDAGLAGVIIGRALYEGQIKFNEIVGH